MGTPITLDVWADDDAKYSSGANTPMRNAPPPVNLNFSRLSAAQMGRRRLLLGYQHNGDPVSLAIRGRTVLIAGEPGTGKSWLGGLLCEQLILQGYCVCVIDPEGDYRSLETLPSVIRR